MLMGVDIRPGHFPFLPRASFQRNAGNSKRKRGITKMMIDMLEEVYKDIEAENAAKVPAPDPSADMMTKALAESNKKVEELKNKIDKLAAAGSSIDNENKESEDETENKNESEENENEDQNA